MKVEELQSVTDLTSVGKGISWGKGTDGRVNQLVQKQRQNRSSLCYAVRIAMVTVWRGGEGINCIYMKDNKISCLWIRR